MDGAGDGGCGVGNIEISRSDGTAPAGNKIVATPLRAVQRHFATDAGGANLICTPGCDGGAGRCGRRRDADLSGLDDDDLLALTRDFQSLCNRMETADYSLLAELDRGRVTVSKGSRSSAGLLRAAANVDR